ncbi:MAG: PEP-CTERM sorting domain-containing protein [Nitrosomonas sp.]|nr:PEP-CTERM sorting domain-containing protein [Nitrosomonas sp.]
MYKVLRGFIAAGVLGLAAGSASANIIFTYDSNQLLSKDAFGNPGPNYSPISMIFEFSDDRSTLIDWSISQPDTGTLTQADANLQQANGLNHPQLIRIDTDSSGNVSDWSISVLKLLEENTSSNAHAVYFHSHSDLSRPGINQDNDVFGLYNFTPSPSESGYSKDPGVWTISSFQPDFHFNASLNYETPSPIPEPSTYLLFLAGLGLLVRHRNRKYTIEPKDHCLLTV